MASKIYSVGIYARLSVDSHSKKNESIETQNEIAKEYLYKQPDMELYGCYSDLGKSGTNFSREGFERLMQDIRCRHVDCIIVKDFSRFGRSYIEMGNYLEKIFPFLGVRFISVTDNFDSLKAGRNPDMLGINLKNLMNELYAKDIAIKVKRSKQMKWEQGSYTGGIPPYGYRAEWRDEIKQLFIDQEPALVVRKLFELYGSGKSQKDMVAWLYENKVHRPGEYRKTGHVYQQDGEILYQWDRGTLISLLQNPVYSGCLLQSCTCGTEYEDRERNKIKDWSFKEHTHEAIICEEIFFQVAERFEKQSKYRNSLSREVPIDEDITKGLLFCGECRKAMTRISSIKRLSSDNRIRSYAYCCRNSSRIDGLVCGKKYITLEMLKKLLIISLKKDYLLAGINPLKLLNERKQIFEKEKQELLRKKEQLTWKAEEAKQLICNQYLQYRHGAVAQEVFIRQKQEYNAKIAKWNRINLDYDKLIKERESLSESQCRFLQASLKFNENSRMDAGFLNTLIKRIEVYPKKRIEITFCYTAADFAALDNEGGKSE